MPASSDRPPDAVFATRLDVVTDAMPNNFVLYFDKSFTNVELFFIPREFICGARVVGGCHFAWSDTGLEITATEPPSETFTARHPLVVLAGRVLGRFGAPYVDPSCWDLFPSAVQEVIRRKLARDSAPRSVTKESREPAEPGVRRPLAGKQGRRIDRLRDEYRPFIEWSDQGILHDLKRMHRVERPSLPLLLALAVPVAEAAGLKITRDIRDRRDLLIGWINRNYDRFRGIIEMIRIFDKTGSTVEEQVQSMRIRVT
jgi:hypothetical protein